MKTEHLSEFILLANTLNFHAAAEQAFTSDSALSRHISLLEKELGFALFSRSTQKVELTPLGREFFSEISPIAARFNSVIDDLRLKSNGYEHTLTIGIPYYGLADYLGMAPAVFSQLSPSSALNYYVGKPGEIINALSANKVDAVIAASAPFMNNEDYTVINLYKEPFIVLMSPENPLSSKKFLTAGDICNEHFLYEESEYHNLLWSGISDLFKEKGFNIGSPKMYPQVETVFSACRNNEGINIAGWNIRSQAKYGLSYIPLREPSFYRNVGLIFKAKHKHKALQYFIRAFDGVKEYGWEDTCPDWI